MAPYNDGRAWLISNTEADVFWIVHYTNAIDGQFEVMATWVKVNSGIPINAVSSKDSAICIRLQNGNLEFLASEQ